MSHFQKQSQQFLSDSPDLLQYAIEYMQEDKGLSNAEIDAIRWSDELNDLIIESLTTYEGSERDLHWWSGRLSLAIELDKVERDPIRVPFTESDLNDLQEWEHFHWTYDGVPLFIFNTDSNPELDPDSDEYDPSITI